MEKPSGFDMSKMSMAGKIIAGAGILLLIDSFLKWQKVCFDFGGVAGLGEKMNHRNKSNINESRRGHEANVPPRSLNALTA